MPAVWACPSASSRPEASVSAVESGSGPWRSRSRSVSPSSSGELPGEEPGDPPQLARTRTALARHSHGTPEFRRATGREARQSSTTRSAVSPEALERNRRAVCQHTRASDLCAFRRGTVVVQLIFRALFLISPDPFGWIPIFYVLLIWYYLRWQLRRRSPPPSARSCSSAEAKPAESA